MDLTRAGRPTVHRTSKGRKWVKQLMVHLSQRLTSCSLVLRLTFAQGGPLGIRLLTNPTTHLQLFFKTGFLWFICVRRKAPVALVRTLVRQKDFYPYTTHRFETRVSSVTFTTLPLSFPFLPLPVQRDQEGRNRHRVDHTRDKNTPSDPLRWGKGGVGGFLYGMGFGTLDPATMDVPFPVKRRYQFQYPDFHLL